MQKIYIALILICLCQITGFSQTHINGLITDATTGEALPGATIEVQGTGEHLTSGNDGRFTFSAPSGTNISIVVSYIGYRTKEITHDPEAGDLQIALEPVVSMLEQTVVTGTRGQRKAAEVPMRINVLSGKRIEGTPAFSADDLLRSVPGVNVRRGAAFLGNSTVSIRGAGNEAGRTLVLADGVPLNKTDGGSVSWNAINPENIEQIEVLKGPGSSIYGGNAMGGVIHLITPTPSKEIEGYLSQEAGSFSTYQSKAGIGGRREHFFWGIDGMYRESDGYITEAAEDIDEYTVASFLDEYQFGGRAGWLFSENHMIEAAANAYNGKRGTGANFSGYGFDNDEIAAPEGAYNQYTSFNARVLYRGSFDDGSRLNITLYGQTEDYQRIRENLRNERITRYDVESVREDAGMTSSYHTPIGESHHITAGIDFRHGSVDGTDQYLTSSDEVINRGNMNQTGFFIQDEIRPGNSPFSVLAGLRYDHASFYDGSFIVNDPTSETDFLQDFAGEIDNASFGAWSPRISFQYHKPDNYRVFAGYSRGFRAPVLDDMSRTGRISGGMKIANPYLKPEYLRNIELGGDIHFNRNFYLGADLFYSTGEDYHAYIATGDSLLLNNRQRPIRIKDNIGEVSIRGMELEAGMKLTTGLNLDLAYSRIHTKVEQFDTFDPSIDDDLVGKEITFHPRDLVYTAIRWENALVNVYLSFNFKGSQWMNETNTEKIDAHNYLDLQLWRPIYRGLNATMKMHNVLDQDFTDSSHMVAPGRITQFSLRYNL